MADRNRSLRCGHCGLVFDVRKSLLSHAEQLHGILPPEDASEPESASPLLEDPPRPEWGASRPEWEIPRPALVRALSTGGPPAPAGGRPGPSLANDLTLVHLGGDSWVVITLTEATRLLHAGMVSSIHRLGPTMRPLAPYYCDLSELPQAARDALEAATAAGRRQPG